MPDIECRIMSSAVTYLLLIQPLGEVNNGWICALVPRMRTLNGGPDSRSFTPLSGSLNTIREEKRENSVDLTSYTHILQSTVVRCADLWLPNLTAVHCKAF